MAFIYSLVAREKVVLAEYYDASLYKGNFVVITRAVLEKLDFSKNIKKAYVYDKYMIHFVIYDRIIYLVVTEAMEQASRIRALAFLEDIHERFTSTYNSAKIENAAAYEMNNEFSRVLAKQMEYFSKDPSVDKITVVRSQIEKVKGIMMENIEALIERSEKIGLLVEKTNQMQTDSLNFKEKSVKVKRKMWWKNFKLWIVIVVLLIILAWLIASAICGFTFQKCASSESPHPSPPPPPPPSPSPTPQ
jgi:vesicle-associated membrane protein 7